MQLSQLMYLFNLVGKSRRVARDISYGKADTMTLDVYAPRDHKPGLPVIIFWHGGSWNGGSKERYPFMGAAIAQMNCIAIIPDYPKFPIVRFPQFSIDAVEVVKWASKHADEYGGDPDTVFLMGHSAGAHTAASLVFQNQYRDAIKSKIAGFIGISGPYKFFPRPYLQSTFPIDDPSQPWVIKPIKTSIPSLLIHGKVDPIVDYRISKRFAHDLKTAGSKVTLRTYWLMEHFSIVLVYALPFRLFPGPWRATRSFIRTFSK